MHYHKDDDAPICELRVNNGALTVSSDVAMDVVVAFQLWMQSSIRKSGTECKWSTFVTASKQMFMEAAVFPPHAHDSMLQALELAGDLGCSHAFVCVPHRHKQAVLLRRCLLQWGFSLVDGSVHSPTLPWATKMKGYTLFGIKVE